MKIYIEVKNCITTYEAFEFPGFWGAGQCKLHVHTNQGDIVFICSQLHDYHGISITNAVETIRDTAIFKLYQDGIISARIRKNIFESIFLSAKKEQDNLTLELRKYADGHSRWIEHYPVGTGAADFDSYAIVEFSESGEPSWSYVNQAILKDQFPGVAIP